MLYSTVLFTALLGSSNSLMSEKTPDEHTASHRDTQNWLDGIIHANKCEKGIKTEAECDPEFCDWTEDKKKCEAKVARSNLSTVEAKRIAKETFTKANEDALKNIVVEQRSERDEEQRVAAAAKVAEAEAAEKQKKKELTFGKNHGARTNEYTARINTTETEKTVTEDDLNSVRDARTQHKAEKNQREQEAKEAAAEQEKKKIEAAAARPKRGLKVFLPSTESKQTIEEHQTIDQPVIKKVKISNLFLN